MNHEELLSENKKLKEAMEHALDILNDHEIYVYHGGKQVIEKIEKILYKDRDNYDKYE